VNSNIKSYVQENKTILSTLIELLKMPSVSADAAYSQDVGKLPVVKLSLETGCDFVEIMKLTVTQLYMVKS
jgi:hypothetical protein